ncbi:MAG: addiction module antidote protein [Sedimentisphaeraceae bacterium JB056]
MMPLHKLEDIIAEDLKGRDGLESFLDTLLEEYETTGDKETFLRLLKIAAKARGGIEETAVKTGLTKQAIYKIFSGKGNPTFNSLVKIIESLGYRLTVKPIN